MRGGTEDTPPSSVNGDEINGLDGEEIIYLDDMVEYDLNDLLDEENDENMELVADQEEEDTEMEPPEDHAIMVFKKHDGSVFCCNFHPEGKLAVTGGEDDKGYVWSVESGEVILECTGHKDSVIFCGFSCDGAYVATAGMCGVIKVWQCNLDTENKQPWPVIFEYETDEITWGQWHFGARVLLLGTVNGDVYVFKIPSGDVKVLQGHNSRFECGKLFHDGIRFAAGYEDGSIKVWDIKQNTVVHHVTNEVQKSRAVAIDTHPDNNLIAASYPDGHVLLITAHNGKIVGNLETEIDLESIAFQNDPESGYLATATLNGSVSIWDAPRQMVRHNCSKSQVNGVTRILWVKNHLITGSLDGSIILYEARSGTRAHTLTGHQSEVLDLCYNEKQNLILTSSDDGTARIFNYEVEGD